MQTQSVRLLLEYVAGRERRGSESRLKKRSRSSELAWWFFLLLYVVGGFVSRNNWWGRAEEGERGAFSYDGGVSHHGEELCIVDDPVLVLVGLLDDGVDLLLRHGLPEEAQHGGQLVAVDVAVPVLRGGWAHRKG